MQTAQGEGYTGRYRGSWVGLFLALTGRALVNPRVAIDLLATGWAFRRRNWLTQFPFLPIPDVPYLKWRMYTAFGDEDAVPPVIDVLRFARWRRETMRL
ncbi:MAG TPA: hypothetical protein VFY20_08485 [Gemmatimonadales bacterium]|nr:hypothetical protein [Gemmatimonadales bacterium]